MIKTIKNKSGEKFGFGIFIVFLSISISLFSFVTEENKITGFAVQENKLEATKITMPKLLEFNDIKSLSLAAGNYYADSDGTVYWIDDESKPAVARVKYVDESQKNRSIYIDGDGNIGYVLKPLEWK